MSDPASGRRRILRARSLFRAADILCDCIHYNLFAGLSKSPSLPAVLTAYVTSRCNMRCRICGIWKTKTQAGQEEMTLEEWDRLLSDPLFSRLEVVNLNGGEPNLRVDLIPMVENLIARHHRLSALSLNSNGIPPERTIFHANEILRLCRPRNIRFSISLSLHRIGEGLDEITGLRNSYPQLQQALTGLKRLRRDPEFHLSVNCVVCRFNLVHLDELLAWSQREEIPVNFVLGEVRDRFCNVEMGENVLIDDQDKPVLIAFLRKLARRKRQFGQHALRYRHLADMIEKGKKRSLACHYYLSGAVVGWDGMLFYCKNSLPIGNGQIRSPLQIYRDPESTSYRAHGLKEDRCLRCPPYTMNKIEIAKDLFKVISDFTFHR